MKHWPLIAWVFLTHTAFKADPASSSQMPLTWFIKKHLTNNLHILACNWSHTDLDELVVLWSFSNISWKLQLALQKQSQSITHSSVQSIPTSNHCTQCQQCATKRLVCSNSTQEAPAISCLKRNWKRGIVASLSEMKLGQCQHKMTKPQKHPSVSLVILMIQSTPQTLLNDAL